MLFNLRPSLAKPMVSNKASPALSDRKCWASGQRKAGSRSYVTAEPAE